MIVSYNGRMTNYGSSQVNEFRGRGRPREFNIEEALDSAIGVFREKGYHATSIGDLTNAMSLASGSIYKAFKDKRAVFAAAFERYVSVRREQLDQRVQAALNGRNKLRAALTFYVDSSYGVEGQRGCLVVGSATELAIFDHEIANMVKESINKNEAFLVKLIQEGLADGSIKPTVNPKATARLLLCVLQGMRVMGKSGRTKAEMAVVVDVAMKVLD